MKKNNPKGKPRFAEVNRGHKSGGTGNDTSKEKIRLFIGVAPDAATQHFLDAISKHCERQGMPRDYRWISHSNRHLTLAFLGETEARWLDTIADRLQEIAGKHFSCNGQIVATHPFPKARAKMLAAELLPTPELATLQRECSALMAAIGKQPERKSFRPHFTIARSRLGFGRLTPIPAEFTCNLNNLTLYHSLLAPGGSQYSPLLALPLQNAP